MLMNSEDFGNNDGDIDLTIIIQIRFLFISFDNYHNLFDNYCNDLVNHSIPLFGKYYFFDNYCNNLVNHSIPLVGKYYLLDNYHFTIIVKTRSLGALRAPTSSWRPFGPLGFVLHALRALRPCNPRVSHWIVCYPLDSVLAFG